MNLFHLKFTIRAMTDMHALDYPFLDGGVLRCASYSVYMYISQLIRFARVCNNVTDFNARNKCLTAKLLRQGHRYHKLRKHFLKFIAYSMISKFNVGIKTLCEGLSEPKFYGDLFFFFFFFF